MPLGDRDSCGSVEAAPSSISRPIRGDYAGFGPNSRAWGQAKRAPAPARCALISIRTGDSRGAGPAAGTPAGPALQAITVRLAGGVRTRDRDRAPSGVAIVGDAVDNTLRLESKTFPNSRGDASVRLVRNEQVDIGKGDISVPPSPGASSKVTMASASSMYEGRYSGLRQRRSTSSRGRLTVIAAL
jgi:hypothetical protein